MISQHEALHKQEPTYNNIGQIKPWMLDVMATALNNHTYPDYPNQSDRLFLASKPYNQNGLIDLPVDTKWSAGVQFPNRHEQIEEVYRMIGYPNRCTLDAQNRALHPWWDQLVSRPDIGGVTGKGFFYRWGANYTADAAAFSNDSDGVPNILLIKRIITNDWALPAGFLNNFENSLEAAKRETLEETSLDIDSLATKPNLLYEGPVLDIRTTLHAWTETKLWQFMLPELESLPPIAPNDDALEVRWYPITELPDDIYGSHPVLIQMAINQTLETTNSRLA